MFRSCGEYIEDDRVTPRPRKKGNRDLPPNLSTSTVKGTVYYRYRDPRTGKYHSLGRDRKQAIADAMSLNTAIYQQIEGRRIDSVLNPSGAVTVAQVVRRYLDMISKPGAHYKKPATVANKQRMFERFMAEYGRHPVASIKVIQIDALLEELREAGKVHMATSFRSTLIALFTFAISKGLCEKNPALATMQVSAGKAKRTRLHLPEFWRIHDQTPHRWAQNAMLLALVTGQRLGDIAAMRFRDVQDGYLMVRQAKTGTPLKLGLSLAIEVRSLESVIAACRDRVISPYLVHYDRQTGSHTRGQQVSPREISRAFQQARDRAGLSWEGSPPTFHEIRSLSCRLYAASGVDAQTLLGHKDAKTTELYKDSRGTEWLVVG